MSFLETVERARTFLERHRRVSLRALRREFALDAATLAELSEELVQVQRVAVMECDVLVWAGAEASAAPPTSIPPPQHDPRSYTPKHLVEKILTTRSSLEGERKQVTVLFADVKGSMDLAAQLDSEDWHPILDGVFRILSDGVHRLEGTINQYAATASWPSSARLLRTNIARSGLVVRTRSLPRVVVCQRRPQIRRWEGPSA